MKKDINYNTMILIGGAGILFGVLMEMNVVWMIGLGLLIGGLVQKYKVTK